MQARALIVAVVLAISAASGAHAEAPPLDQAILNYDVAAVTEAAGGSAPASLLARGVLEAWRHQDQAALADLNRAKDNTAIAAPLRRLAWMTISDIALRQSRFADTAAAIAASRQFGAAEDPTAEAMIEQARTFAAALAHVAPMQANIPAHGSTALTRDMAGIMRADISAGGATLNAVLDTGAGFSTITETNATRLGLTRLDAAVTVGNAAAQNIATHLAVADRLQFAGAEYRNVVFIVLPDAALSFGGGAYTIDAIIGLPVLMQLGRLEFARDAQNHFTLNYGPSREAPGAASNLILDGVQVYARANLEGGAQPLAMFVDTGAQQSNFTQRALADIAALAAQAHARAATVSGAGGSATQQDAQIVDRTTLMIGAAPVRLDNVRVIREHGRRHGAIGEDALWSGSGYVLDFTAMRLAVTPR